MNLNEWAQVESLKVIKKISLTAIVLLFPIFLGYLYLVQESQINSLFISNNKILLNALQTGDLVALQKTLSGYQLEDSIISYVLYDKENIEIKKYKSLDTAIFIFENQFKITNSLGMSWGTLIVRWSLKFRVIIYFVFSFIFIFLVVTFLILRIWQTISTKLVFTLDQTIKSLDLSEIHPSVNEIDDLRSFINQVKSLQSYELESQKMQIKIENERQLFELSQKVAHDIRSPLSVLNMLIPTLSYDPSKEKCELLVNATHRIEKIAEDLLMKGRDLEKIEILSFKDFENLIIEKQILLESQSKMISLILDAPKEFKIKTKIPKIEIERIISNLLNNAIEAFTDKTEGCVTISLIAKSNSTLLVVKDNGSGIDPSILSKIGLKGFTSGKESGNGLGIYHAKSIIEKFDGRFKIESSLGIGTIITIVI